jgi:hypothetical protein
LIFAHAAQVAGATSTALRRFALLREGPPFLPLAYWILRNPENSEPVSLAKRAQWLHARAIAIETTIIIWKCDPNFILRLFFPKIHLIEKGGCDILIFRARFELSSLFIGRPFAFDSEQCAVSAPCQNVIILLRTLRESYNLIALAGQPRTQQNNNSIFVHWVETLPADLFTPTTVQRQHPWDRFEIEIEDWKLYHDRKLKVAFLASCR